MVTEKMQLNLLKQSINYSITDNQFSQILQTGSPIGFSITFVQLGTEGCQAELVEALINIG